MLAPMNVSLMAMSETEIAATYTVSVCKVEWETEDVPVFGGVIVSQQHDSTSNEPYIKVETETRGVRLAAKHEYFSRQRQRTAAQKI